MKTTNKCIVSLILSYSISTLVWAQSEEEILEHGEKVYIVTCATGYCHTLNGGAGGGAARLAARGFDLDYITQTVSFGLHKTKMLGFAASLPEDELLAVITYVAALNGISTNGGTIVAVGTTSKPQLSAAASKGKDLLHESLRAFGRCATCHQVDGSGVPVADPIDEVPATVKALRRLGTPKVTTVTIAGERMPALILRQGATRTLFYDLTSSPPVRRNVGSDSIKIKAGSGWRHASALGTYTNKELENILVYLRAVVE